jgi:CHAD domain-containing protein
VSDPGSGELLRAALDASLRTLRSSLAALGGDADADAIHNARVEVRKMRSLVATYAPLVEAAWAQEWSERLADLGAALGSARDATVLIETLRPASARIPEAERASWSSLIADLRARERSGQAGLLSYLSSEETRSLLARLDGALASLHVRGPVPASRVVPGLLRERWKKIRRRARRARREPADRDLHRLRIAAKHLRYAAEAFEPVCGRRVRRVARAAERLQSVLGDYHDIADARAALRRMPAAPTIADADADLERRGRACLAKWPKRWKALADLR